ncbi:MAG TPA: hypothetical protein VI078_08920, partial [bacterium]
MPRTTVRVTLALAVALLPLCAAGRAAAAAPEAPRWVAQRFIGERSAVGLAWTAVPGAERYLILRRAEGEEQARQIGATPGLQYLDAAVTRGVRYRYSVCAAGPGGTGPVSAEAEVLALEPQLIPPAAPRWTDAVAASEGDAPAVRLLWAPVSGAVVYNVFRRTPADPPGAFRLRAGVADCTFTDTEVGAGAYEYRLSAVSAAMVEGALSDVRSVTLAAARAGGSQRTAGPALRVRPSREALVLRGGEKLPILAPVDIVASP